MASPVDPTLVKRNNVKVRLEVKPGGWRSRVFVGDTELTGVFGVRIESTVHSATVVHLDMYALGGVTVEGIADVLAAAITTEAQLKAGTPKDSTAEVTAFGDANRVFRRGEAETE